jgi:hypothetical protein
MAQAIWHPVAYHAPVLWNRARSLPDLCARLSDAVCQLDLKASTKAARAIAAELEKASDADLADGLARLAPALRQVAIGNGGGLIRVIAGLVEAGADPLPVLDVLSERVADGLENAARFPALAAVMGGDLAAPTAPAEANALLERTTAAAAKSGIGAHEAGLIMQAWFTVNDWMPGLLLPLQQKRARIALPGRARLTAAAAAMEDHAGDVPWLLGLLHVLDGEQLIVIHRETRRTYQVTIGGIGDNFQLHTLLAATLIGDPSAGLIAGERPHRSWIAAATGGDMTPPVAIHGQFNLVAGNGEWIWNEGRPAGIPALSGRRVIVLDPPPYERTWNTGRPYPLMTPQIRLDRVLPAGESASWVSQIAPATQMR